MYYRIKHNPSAIIVLSEIYGITASIRSACDMFYDAGFDTIAPNYLSMARSFRIDEETIAHSHYTSIGMEGARESARNFIARLRPHYEHLFIAGYSAGGTIAWLLSSEKGLCDGIAVFYGRKIGDHASIVPQVPTYLAFPSYEPSFDTHTLADKLTSDLVTAHVFEGTHGFANHLSPHHHAESSDQAHHEAVNFFKEITSEESVVIPL
jgi:dienelactone hydrolase